MKSWSGMACLPSFVTLVLLNAHLGLVHSQESKYTRQRASPKEFPHMAILGYGDADNIRWTAVGSLVSSRFILTAAHVMQYRPGPIGEVRWARVGDINVHATTDDSRPQTFRVVRRIPHPQFQPPSLYHDIGLLLLNDSVQMNSWVRPVCLHTNHSTLVDQQAILTGWGRNEKSETKRKLDLAKLDVLIQPEERCIDSFGRLSGSTGNRLARGFTAESMICARDPCIGENGGPLQFAVEDEECLHTILGITSFGPALCGLPEGVASYTRVSYYTPWIQSLIGTEGGE